MSVIRDLGQYVAAVVTGGSVKVRSRRAKVSSPEEGASGNLRPV